MLSVLVEMVFEFVQILKIKFRVLYSWIHVVCVSFLSQYGNSCKPKYVFVTLNGEIVEGK